MAKNNMTAQQDLMTREFMVHVLSDDLLFPGDPVGQGKAQQMCRRLLGYVIIDGKHVSYEVAKAAQYKFGKRPVVEDEWADDTRRVVDEVNKYKDSLEAGSSEPSEDTEVREAVLSEDV